MGRLKTTFAVPVGSNKSPNHKTTSSHEPVCTENITMVSCRCLFFLHLFLLLCLKRWQKSIYSSGTRGRTCTHSILPVDFRRKCTFHYIYLITLVISCFKSSFLCFAGSRVVRAHATNAVDLSSNPAGGPELHVTPPTLSPFLSIHCQIKGVYA